MHARLLLLHCASSARMRACMRVHSAAACMYVSALLLSQELKEVLDGVRTDINRV
jgi:hypothetical protein